MFPYYFPQDVSWILAIILLYPLQYPFPTNNARFFEKIEQNSTFNLVRQNSMYQNKINNIRILVLWFFNIICVYAYDLVCFS